MISMIVAHDLARNIGYQGDMPWGRDMKGDLGRFKELTDGKTIIMGRKTFESLPGLLPNRFHVVLSNKNFVIKSPNVLVANSLGKVIDLAIKSNEESFVIGGASIYEQFMPYADRLYITKIHELFEGDIKFPSIKGAWDMVYSPKLLVEGDKYPSQYITLTRRSV